MRRTKVKRACAFGIEQQKKNSVLNVKKPLASKELIFMCRCFRLFSVDLLTLNINPLKAFPRPLILPSPSPIVPLRVFFLGIFTI